jgi:hypothetical protein
MVTLGTFLPVEGDMLPEFFFRAIRLAHGRLAEKMELQVVAPRMTPARAAVHGR